MLRRLAQAEMNARLGLKLSDTQAKRAESAV